MIGTIGNQVTLKMFKSGLILFFISILSGCSLLLSDFQPSVAVSNIKPQDYIAQQRGDVLTTGKLSLQTRQTILVSGLDNGVCAKPDSLACLHGLAEFNGVSEESKLSALAEIWLLYAITTSKDVDARNVFSAWLESARYAYAYLFYTPRTPGDRAFEDRQTLVKDWYNYAVQQATTLLFQAKINNPYANETDNNYAIKFDDWRLNLNIAVRLPKGVRRPDELISANILNFKGLRSTYRRDGFGAEFIAVIKDQEMPKPASPVQNNSTNTKKRWSQSPGWSEMPSPDITVVYKFVGDDLEQILGNKQVDIDVLDPFMVDRININGQAVPLAGNFTAGYGFWLAQSGFSRQSLRSLFGREQGIERPQLFMMQPYDPNKRVILMVHGLASSPEAWVNLANEILGDEQLRNEFQVWQIYYPTNLPIVINHALIRKLLQETIMNFDPESSTQASQDMVLIGHSMGGMIGRLMVSTADTELWNWVQQERDIDSKNLNRLHRNLDPILQFEPVPNIGRAIFIATPHKGTKVAGNNMVRWLSGFVRLPLVILKNIDEALVPKAYAGDTALSARKLAIPSSFDNLDENDAFVIAAANLPIAAGLEYHSIIARKSADGPLLKSDDGFVPYTSSHLDGAQSEAVIVSGHSVQESAESILEIRRILKEDINTHKLN